MNYRKRLKGLLAYNMSEDLKQKILDALDSPNTSESELKTLNQELQSRKVLLKDHIVAYFYVGDVPTNVLNQQFNSRRKKSI